MNPTTAFPEDIEDDYDPLEEEFRAIAEAHRKLRKESSCLDGYCGAPDCERCGGQ